MDPTLRPRIVETLRRDIGQMPRGLQRAARYVIDHPSDFGLDPIRETARKAGVSPYTLVRLAQRLELDGYDALRAPFRQALVSGSAPAEPPAWIARAAGSAGQVQAEAALNAMSIVRRTIEANEPARIDRAVAMMTQARAVHLTAARASFALAYHLHYVGRMALPTLGLIPRHMNSPLDDLGEALPGDVLLAITFAPYSRETIEACRFAHRRGLRLLLISDSEIVSPDFTAEVVLVASTLSTHHFGCHAGAMALIEMLIARLVAQGGEAARERIAGYEALRGEARAYWSVPKKR